MDIKCILLTKQHHGLRNPELLKRIYKGPPIPPVLRIINPIPLNDTYFLGVHYNIVLPLHLYLLKGLKIYFTTFYALSKIVNINEDPLHHYGTQSNILKLLPYLMSLLVPLLLLCQSSSPTEDRMKCNILVIERYAAR